MMRYVLEILTYTVVRSVKGTMNWEKYWEESGCASEEGSGSFICKAVGLCIQEVVPELIPSSPDDIIIQLLLMGLMFLAAGFIDVDLRAKKD